MNCPHFMLNEYQKSISFLDLDLNVLTGLHLNFGREFLVQGPMMVLSPRLIS